MIEFSTEQQAIQAIARALKAEEDGNKLRRQLAAEFRAALEPAKDEIRTALMGMSTSGMPHSGAPLRTTAMQGLQVQARLTGQQTGARLRARKSPELRGFALAARRMNRKKGWRHQGFGNEEHWYPQIGEPDYFDDATLKRANEYRDALLKAAKAMEDRILERVRARK